MGPRQPERQAELPLLGAAFHDLLKGTCVSSHDHYNSFSEVRDHKIPSLRGLGADSRSKRKERGRKGNSAHTGVCCSGGKEADRL